MRIDNICPHCGTNNTHASEAGGSDRQPEPGDPTLCYQCGGFAVFGDNLVPRFPTHAEGAEMARDPKLIVQVGAATVGLAVLKGQRKVREN